MTFPPVSIYLRFAYTYAPSGHVYTRDLIHLHQYSMLSATKPQRIMEGGCILQKSYSRSIIPEEPQIERYKINIVYKRTISSSGRPKERKASLWWYYFRKESKNRLQIICWYYSKGPRKKARSHIEGKWYEGSPALLCAGCPRRF